jgi:uncharacterized membrane protein
VKGFALTYVVTMVVMLAIDIVWLVCAYKPLYQPAMGHLLAPKPDMVAGGIFYPIYVFGLTYLILWPAITSNAPWWDLAVRAGLFGLVAYATYDLTNHAVLRDWPAKLTAIDMAWGTVMTLSVSLISVFIVRTLKIAP